AAKGKEHHHCNHQHAGTRNDIGNINSFIRDKYLKRFPLLYSKFI
ncbi:hypothetical protein EC971742_3481, partial [Escherichia coli 97.1742]